MELRGPEGPGWCLDVCQQPLPLRLRGHFVLSQVLEVFAWLMLCQCGLPACTVSAQLLASTQEEIKSQLLCIQMKWNTLYKWTQNKKPCTSEPHIFLNPSEQS